MNSLGIIGFGNMGEALVRGLRANQPAVAINVIEKAEARRTLAVEACSARDFGSDYAAFMAASEVVVLAIKPQDIGDLMQALRPYSKGARFVSILAGKTIDYFLGASQTREVVRFMPSLAAAVGQSVTGVSCSPDCGAAFRADALAIARSIGSAFEIPERLMPAIVGVSGSGIAYAFEFANALAMGGVRAGLPYATSLGVALDVLAGAAATLKANGVHPADMTSRVCSPGGTTIEGVQALADGGFAATVMNAVKAAADRSRELEN